MGMEKVVFYQEKDDGQGGKKLVLNPTLFSVTAMGWAEGLAKCGKKTNNKRSQIRRFYDEVMKLNQLANVNSGGTALWDDILPYVNMLLAKAAYAQGRDLVSPEFVDFLKQCIEKVQTQKDLAVFTNFFEAFMGFYRQFRKD